MSMVNCDCGHGNPCPSCLSRYIEQLRKVALESIEESRYRYDCLPEGWIAVREGPFMKLKEFLVDHFR